MLQHVQFRICSTLGKKKMQSSQWVMRFYKSHREKGQQREMTQFWHLPALLLVHLRSYGIKDCAVKECTVLASQNISAGAGGKVELQEKGKCCPALIQQQLPSPSPQAASTKSWSSAGPPARYQGCTQTDSWWLTSSHWSQTLCVKSFIFSWSLLLNSPSFQTKP